MAALDFPLAASSPYTDPTGKVWAHDGIAWASTGLGPVSSSKEAVSFSIDLIKPSGHWYSVTGASVVVTLPLGMGDGYRFTIYAKADTTFVITGVTVNLPLDKALLPFGDGAAIGFTVVGTNEVDAYGDLIDA